MVADAVAVPALTRLTVDGIVQVMPEGAVQVSAIAPLKPLTEARLMVSAELPPAAKGTMLEFGVMVKSDRGFVIGLASANKEALYTVSPAYTKVKKLFPADSFWLFRTKEKVETSPGPGTSK
jgi:hypothetical protein